MAPPPSRVNVFLFLNWSFMISFSKSLTDDRSPWILTHIRLSFPPSHPSFLPHPPGLSSIYSCPAGPFALQACCTAMPCSPLEPRPRKSLCVSPVSNPVFSRCCDMLLWGRSLISRSVLGLFPSAVHPLVTSREEGHVRVNVGRPVCLHVSHLYGVGLGKTAPAGTVRPQMVDVTAALPRALLPPRVAVERSSATCLLTLVYDLFPLLEALPFSSLWRLLWDFTTLCFGVVLFSLSVLGTRWAASIRISQKFSYIISWISVLFFPSYLLSVTLIFCLSFSSTFCSVLNVYLLDFLLNF